jgi:hypothetical protein
MRQFYLSTILLISLYSSGIFAQNAGFFGTPLSFVEYNNTLVEADNFNGSNLGTLATLTLNGAEIRTFKNGTGDVTGAFLYYSIYEASSSGGSFTEVSIPFSDDDLGDGPGGNQLWKTSALGTDLISGLTNGNYKFEVFFKISTNEGDIFQSDNGNNYTADFSVPYRTTQSGPWNSGTTWVGGVVPPSGSNVSIEHNVNLDISTSVTSVQIASGTTLTVDVGNTLISNGGIIGTGSFTVNGTWRIEAGGFTSIAPTYGSSSTLVYAAGLTYGRGTEWSATSGAGYPHNVTISSNTTLELGANGGTGAPRQCAGNLTVESGSTLTLASPVMTEELIVVGNFLNNGTTILSSAVGGDLFVQGNFNDSGTFTSNNRAVFFTGGNAQTVTSSTNPLVIDFLLIDKSANDVTMNQNLDLPNNLTLTSGNLDLNGRTLTISGDIIPTGGSVIANGMGSTVVFDNSSTARTIEVNDFQNDEITNLTVSESSGVTVNTNVTVSNNLDVTATGNLVVSPGNSITVTNNNVNTTGTLTLNSISNSYSSLIVEGTATGDVTYNRYTAEVGPTGTNDLVSSPVTGLEWGAFLTDNTGVLAANGAGTEFAFAPFDNDNDYANPSDYYVNYDNNTGGTTAITSGRGYRAATVNGETLTYTGGVATGDILANVTVGASTVFGQWNLIGNPYPSYISTRNFLTNTNNQTLMGALNVAIYGYDGDVSNGWNIRNLSNVPEEDTELMAPGQGFFVAATANGNIEFKSDLRRTGGGDDYITGRNANTLTYVVFGLSSSTNSYATSLYFNDASSLGLDIGYDAGIFGGSAPAFAIYSELVADPQGVPIALQSLNTNDLSSVTIPLGVNANQGQQITFSITENALPAGTEVYLDDTLENTSTLLTSGDYTLSPTTDLNGTGRFFIRFENNALSTPEIALEGVSIFTENKDIVISGALTAATTLRLYDLQGRLITETPLQINRVQQRIATNNVTSGIYIVELNDGQLSKTKKIIIN